MTASEMRQNPDMPTDTAMAGSVAVWADKRCLCCDQALLDGRHTRLCNECFHSLRRDPRTRLVCGVHRRRVDPTETGNW